MLLFHAEFVADQTLRRVLNQPVSHLDQPGHLISYGENKAYNTSAYIALNLAGVGSEGALTTAVPVPLARVPGKQRRVPKWSAAMPF